MIVEIGKAQASKASKHLKKRLQQLKKDMPKELKREAVKLRNRVRIEIRAHANDPTGALENSWVAAALTGRSMVIKSDSRYARIRDQGGVIRAKSAKYLTIPLLKSLKGMTPRNVPGGTFIRSKRGNLLYILKWGKEKDAWTPLFVLKKSVYQYGWDYIEKARARWAEKASLIGVFAERKSE